MSRLTEQIFEINENFNDIGADLVLLEALLREIEEGRNFPIEFIELGLKRLGEFLSQHTGDITYLSGLLIEEASQHCRVIGAAVEDCR